MISVYLTCWASALGFVISWPNGIRDILKPGEFTRVNDRRSTKDWYYRGSNVIQVGPGDSIQVAIDEASSGDKIVVEAGTYAEQLTINKDSISIIGHGATLVPPAQPVMNSCSGLFGPETNAGICVEGADITLEPYTVEHREVRSVGREVRGVTVARFQVNGFKGAGISTVGARDAQIIDNTLIDNPVYGYLTDGSTSTVVQHNKIFSQRALGFIGLCMDNMVGVDVSDNEISGYDVALCVQHQVPSCIIINADVSFNQFTGTHPGCGKLSPAMAYLGYGSFGIIVDWSSSARVMQNVIENEVNHGFGTGIAVVDNPYTEQALTCLTRPNVEVVASGNMITHNTLRGNDLDIYINTVGSGNVIEGNVCSKPKKYCGTQA